MGRGTGWLPVVTAGRFCRRWTGAAVATAVSASVAVLGPASPARADAAGGGGIDRGAVQAWVERYSTGGFGGPQCRWTPPGDAGSRPEGTVEVDGAGRVWLLYARGCDGAIAAIWVPDVTPDDLGAAAVSRVRRLLPEPLAAFSPTTRSVTQLPTWFWVPLDRWRPVTATASVPGASATAVAVPTTVRVDPGPGDHSDGPVSCPGPGPVWAPGAAADDSPCRFTYRRTPAVVGARVWPLTLSLDWRITTTVLGAPGPSASAVTVTVTAREVVEYHALGVAVSGGGPVEGLRLHGP